MIEGGTKALRERLMQHVENEYRRTGKDPGGEAMIGYLEQFEKLSSVPAFEELLAKITQDAEA